MQVNLSLWKTTLCIHYHLKLITHGKRKETYMMERRQSVWRKEKLAEAGKPDLKMPLSTMEKFKGGIRVSSSPARGGKKAGSEGRSTTDATSIVMHISFSSSSSIICLVELSTFITFWKKKKKTLDFLWVGWDQEECDGRFRYWELYWQLKDQSLSREKMVALVVKAGGADRGII